MGIASGIFLLIGIALFLIWLFDWRFEKSTDDAYVHGNAVIVTPQIQGNIETISVNDTDLVEEGHILVTLNAIDQTLAFESAKHELGQTVRTVAQFYEEVGARKGELEMRNAAFTKAAQDYQHRKAVVKEGAVSVEEFEHAKAAFIEAFASLLSTQHQLRKALVLIENTDLYNHPLIEKAKDRVKQTYVDWNRCTIRSPARGIVAMKKGQVGESVLPQSPLMTIIPLDQIWINANFKENKLKEMRIGQTATITTDLYGSDVVFHGKISGISGATGSVLSVLPPQNATGNWIKIVQRLPVRIHLDPDQIAHYPLRLGLSAHVKVDIRDTRGKRIPPPATSTDLYDTTIFGQQEAGVEKIIQEIIQKNSKFSFDSYKVSGDGRKKA